MVLKPAELTPLTAMRLGELALEAGLPEGVFQVLPGKGSVVGQRFVDHPAGRARSCSPGPPRSAAQIMAGCAAQVKRVTLELGGKSANIVFADADLERAAATAPVRGVRQRRPGLLRPLPDPGPARRSTTGSWSCSSRRCKGVRVGDPALEPDRDGAADLGRAAATGWPRYVPDDAPVAFRGSAPDGPGFWFPPTVLAPAGPDSPGRSPRRSSGRSSPVVPFEDEADAIAHRQRHRLRAVRLDLDPRRRPGASGWPARVETGNLSVNSHSSVRYWTPFGGFKQSGLGRELGPDALDAFTETKNVFISTEREPR